MRKNKFLKYFLVFLLVIALLLVRFLQDFLFYDPFLDFFKNTESPISNFDESKFWFSTVFRYFLNGFLGFFIVANLFESKIYKKFYLLVLVVAFFVLLPIYAYFVYDGFSSNPMIGFYVRRFVIQPIFLLILLPVFFFFDRIEKSKNL